MAITQAFCVSFKVELMEATHNLSTGQDVIKLALFRSGALISGSFGAATTNYSQMGADEVSGTNYVAGGAALTNVTPTSSGTTAWVSFANLTFSNVTLTTSGALLYNSSKSNKALIVLNFGADKTKTAGDLVITMPSADASNAIIRLV
jgi:hypothetical protein